MLLLVTVLSLSPAFGGMAHAGLREKATVENVTQQATKIQGTIKDEKGEPIVGANVYPSGNKAKSTTTDVNGAFTLTVPIGSTLEVTFIGYKNMKVAVKSSTLDVVMTEDSKQLGEIVFTGFGMTQSKESLTGAVSTIKSKDIERSSASTTSGALVGKIAGINSRQADGRPGASTSIQIRNMGTPLFVIDGIQMDEGQFNNLDFNDIETVSVLKDASSAIYGVRAANGVVVVTTKKGKLNTKPTVSLNVTQGWQNLSRMAKPADVKTYISNYIQSETLKPGLTRKYTMDDLAKWTAGTEKGYVPFDWYDYIWNTAPQTYVGANISGGSESTNYYVAVSNLNQDAMIQNYGGFNRSNVQMNINTQINKRLKVGAGLNGRTEQRVNPGVPGGDDYWCPIFATYRNLPTARPFANDNPKYPAKTAANTDVNFAMLNYELSGRMEDTWRVMQLDFNGEYKIFDGLKAMGRFSYYIADHVLNNQEYTYTLYKYNEDKDIYEVDFANTNPWRERGQGKVMTKTTNLQLNYDKKFGEHSVSAIAGVETSTRDTPHNWVHAIPASNALRLIYFNTLDTYDDYGNNTEARIGYIGRLNYSYGNKYLFETSARYDGSWKFPPTKRWGLFPSIQGGWRISEENFWKESRLSTIFNDLKIRANYGLLGDDNLGDDNYAAFDYMPGYNYRLNSKNERLPASTLDGQYTIGSQPRNLPVTNITWIKANIFDIGVDAGFIQNRLTTTIDFFRRSRTGLPAERYDVLLPSEVGFKKPKENLNSDATMGMDAMVRWTDNVGDFSYSVGVNGTYARKYDWHQYKPRFNNSLDKYRNSINERYANITWGLQCVGQFQSWEEIANYDIDNDGKGNTDLRPGDLKYKDVNGDKRIDGLDDRPIGYAQGATPILNFGINVSLNYKQWDMAFDLTGASGASYYQDWEARRPFHDGGNNAQYYMEDTWRLSDIMDANSELIPGKYPTLLIGNSGHSNYWTSDFWVHNVTYMKLRNFEFGYTLPKNVLKKALISDLRLFVSGQNLLTFTNLTGHDPEITSTNGLQYPTTRIMNVGLTLKF